MGVGDQAAFRNKLMRLNESGVDTPAIVKTITETGNTDVGGGTETTVRVWTRTIRTR